MTVTFGCAMCSYVYEIDDNWIARTAPSAPVHPVHQDSGRVVWRMCAGSAKQGVARTEGGSRAAAQR